MGHLALKVLADPLKSLEGFRDPPLSLIEHPNPPQAHTHTFLRDHLMAQVPSSVQIPLLVRDPGFLGMNKLKGDHDTSASHVRPL